MEAIPQEWVDKIFECMELFYKDRWTSNFRDDSKKEWLKTIWRNGLTGLTYEQIKYGLQLCKRAAQHNRATPPHVMKFFRYAKGTDFPYIFNE